MSALQALAFLNIKKTIVTAQKTQSVRQRLAAAAGLSAPFMVNTKFIETTSACFLVSAGLQNEWLSPQPHTGSRRISLTKFKESHHPMMEWRDIPYQKTPKLSLSVLRRFTHPAVLVTMLVTLKETGTSAAFFGMRSFYGWQNWNINCRICNKFPGKMFPSCQFSTTTTTEEWQIWDMGVFGASFGGCCFCCYVGIITLMLLNYDTREGYLPVGAVSHVVCNYERWSENWTYVSSAGWVWTYVVVVEIKLALRGGRGHSFNDKVSCEMDCLLSMWAAI